MNTRIKAISCILVGVCLAITSPAAERTAVQFEKERGQAAAAKRQAAEAAKAKREEKARPAKADMRIRLATAKEQLARVKLPEDTSARLTVKEIRFNGNTLVSTAELFDNMPVVFNASDKPLAKAESSALYDFTALYEIILEPGTAREVSARTIQGLTQYVLSLYQDKHYAGIYVFVPAEALKGGKGLEGGVLLVDILELPVVEVGVTFYDASQNKVEKGYLDANTMLGWSPTARGQVANKKKLDDYVNLLNLNPDRYVSAVVSKGSEPNTLAVKYEVYEANPWHFFIQADNSGTRERQWNPRVGAVSTNLLGRDDSFFAMVQGPLDSDIKDNYSLFGSYDFPLAVPELRVTIYGGYSEFDLSPQASDIDFVGGGKFIGANLRYNILQVNDWFFDITGSLSHEESKVSIPQFEELFPDYAGLFSTDIKMGLWGAGFNIHRRDDISNSSLSFKATESMGTSNEQEFSEARTGGADRDFTIYTVSAAHSRYLDPNRVSRLSGSLRWVGTEDRLVPAKMTPFGGMYSVRGYDEYERMADGGVLASAQYEFDLVRYEKTKGVSKQQADREERLQNRKWGLKKLAPLVFFDFGRAQINEPTGTEKGHETFVSIGPGALVEIGNNFSGAVYVGIPLKATQDTDSGDVRLNASVMMRW